MRNFQAFWANPWWLWGIWSSSQISIGPWAATTPRKEGSWRHTLKVCLGVPKVDRWWVGYGSRVNSEETPQHWLSIYILTSTELFILGMREEDRGYRSFDPFASICMYRSYCMGSIRDCGRVVYRDASRDWLIVKPAFCFASQTQRNHAGTRFFVSTLFAWASSIHRFVKVSLL